MDYKAAYEWLTKAILKVAGDLSKVMDGDRQIFLLQIKSIIRDSREIGEASARRNQKTD